jgi:hypothetical protein
LILAAALDAIKSTTLIFVNGIVPRPAAELELLCNKPASETDLANEKLNLSCSFGCDKIHCNDFYKLEYT